MGRVGRSPAADRPWPVAQCSGNIDSPPAPLWLVAMQEKTTLKMYLHSMMLSSAQLHAIELALTAAVQAIVHHVNSRLLLDEVGRYVAAWRLWNRPPDNDPRRDCCVGGVTAPCNTRV